MCKLNSVGTLLQGLPPKGSIDKTALIYAFSNVYFLHQKIPRTLSWHKMKAVHIFRFLLKKPKHNNQTNKVNKNTHSGRLLHLDIIMPNTEVRKVHKTISYYTATGTFFRTSWKSRARCCVIQTQSFFSRRSWKLCGLIPVFIARSLGQGWVPWTWSSIHMPTGELRGSRSWSKTFLLLFYSQLLKKGWRPLGRVLRPCKELNFFMFWWI